jgi:hypothetical protein
MPGSAQTVGQKIAQADRFSLGWRAEADAARLRGEAERAEQLDRKAQFWAQRAAQLRINAGGPVE